ncbi:MAG: hypothetical protein KJ062_16345 [Thermoanaerobaculia bacterium]|nr:hypothetical protein [Thermoanaerobaculia bacterium]
MATGPRRFSPRELVLPPPAAWEVLRFFFPGDMVGLYTEDLSVEDRLFAQELLVAALDETRTVGAPVVPGETPLVAAGFVRIRAIAHRLVERAPGAWFSSPPPEGGDAARIDEPSRAAVSIRHRAGWLAHVRGGPLL